MPNPNPVAKNLRSPRYRKRVDCLGSGKLESEICIIGEAPGEVVQSRVKYTRKVKHPLARAKTKAPRHFIPGG